MNPLRPVVNWNIVGGCNYRCSYCVQKHANGVGGPDDARLDAGLDTLCALPGSWEIKISGGEPFLLKRLPEVAARLAAAGHKVSILTNLSPSLAVIERFVNAAGERLRTFSCSLHIEQVSVEEFLAKAMADPLSPAPLPRGGEGRILSRWSAGDGKTQHAPLPCFAGYLYSRVYVDGRVFFCCEHIEVGHVDETDFGTVWLAPTYDALRQRLHNGQGFPGCARCGKHDMNFVAAEQLAMLMNTTA